MPSSSLPAQVVEVAVATETTGTEAEIPSPPADHQMDNNGQRILIQQQNDDNGQQMPIEPPLRRSRRIQDRNGRTGIT